MNFDQMEHIVTVANEKSITKAADKLYISTSGLSQSITQLEMELGIKIFNRSKKNITPTFEGEIVISTASTILKNINEMNNKLSYYKNDNELHLKIYIAPTFFYPLQEIMVKFHLEKKDLTFELVEKNPFKILENFNKENYDFALIPAALEDLKKVQNISFKHIYRGHICIAVGKNSPFYSRDFVTLKDIKNSKFVLLETADKNQLLKFTKINPEQVIMSSSRSNILLKIVKQSDAILYVHDFTLKNFPMVLSGDLKIIPLMDDEKLIELDFWIIYLESKGLSNLSNEFLEDFIEHFKKYI
ncbi:LysR family transcriptional regulator [Gottfriedia acidiceleris]|uniref:LysR family transcriptional regulator n=1 Tax=Gottfriedia acidiceleris TaxID=371036 RepID=A0ABY4JJF1_9BACI|nr:LysR family transcriptional regulator [Gottfriedia acidiceleris]UPM53974.1 LysR family transcriptional regulator [Gottfriedia acidiceleris]